MGLEQIYSKIAARQTEAVMLHSELADMCKYYSLDGYHALHKYRFAEESEGMFKVSEFYISNHGNIIQTSSKPEIIDIIPPVYKNTPNARINDTETTKEGIDYIFRKWHEWEDETLRMYEDLAKELLNMNYISDAIMVGMMVKDVSGELALINDIRTKLLRINYDLPTVYAEQENLKKEYCKKLKKLFE